MRMRHWLLAAVVFAVLLLTLLFILVPVSSAAFIDCPALGTCWGTDDGDDMNGTSGYDEMRGLDGPDDIRGYGSGDDLYGGGGRDFLKPGGGDDFVKGGGGSDDINISSDDSGGDFADCGDGDDEVWADPNDVTSPDCEIVHIVS